jgi:hypothetical protein
VQYQEFIAPRLGDTSRVARFIFKPRNDSISLLDAASIRDMFVAYQRLQGVMTAGGGHQYRIADLCWRTPSGVFCARAFAALRILHLSLANACFQTLTAALAAATKIVCCVSTFSLASAA